jgi:hypothetical protein
VPSCDATCDNSRTGVICSGLQAAVQDATRCAHELAPAAARPTPTGRTAATVAGVGDVEAYQWIVDYDHSWLANGACVTVVRGLDLAGTVSAFGGDPSVGPIPLHTVYAGVEPDVAAIGVLDDVVVVVEPNGFAGSRPEVLRLASAAGPAASVFWNINLHTRFSYAVDGQVVTSFELQSPDYRFGTDPDRLLPEMEGLPFGLEAPIPAGLALVERVIGRALSREDINGVTDVWRLVPHLPDLYPKRPEYHNLRYDHADLVDLVAGAGSHVQRQVAALAAERAAAASGLDRDPVVRQALAGLRTAPGSPLSPEAAEQVRQHLHRSSLAHAAMNGPGDSATALAHARELSRPANAANALYVATNPDPLSAGLDALDSARHVAGESLLEDARALCRAT